MTTPADDSPLRIVPQATPRPKLLASAATETARIDVPAKASRKTQGALLFLSTALFAGFVVAGADHWFRHEYMAPGRPLSVLKPIRQALPTPPSAPLEVNADALHVSTIVLGSPPLTVVNGKQLAEGDWLEVRTTNGVAALRVIKIEDGAVHFGYGGHVIDATFDSQVAAKRSP